MNNQQLRKFYICLFAWRCFFSYACVCVFFFYKRWGNENFTNSHLFFWRLCYLLLLIIHTHAVMIWPPLHKTFSQTFFCHKKLWQISMQIAMEFFFLPEFLDFCCKKLRQKVLCNGALMFKCQGCKNWSNAIKWKMNTNQLKPITVDCQAVALTLRKEKKKEF